MNLDSVDLRILAILQDDARVALAEIGRRIHLSQPAVAERVRRLEASGVIRGYGAQVSPAALGYSLQAIVRVMKEPFSPVEEWVKERPEVVECHTVTGDDCLVLKVLARDVAHLEQLLSGMKRHGRTSTSIILSSTIERRPVRPASELDLNPSTE